MGRRRILVLLVVALGATTILAPGHACTTAVVSGKATPDGRPLLFKHRDSDAQESRLVYLTDGRYPYIGLVNAGDSSGAEVWVGCNSAGFAIMNSASYNLNVGDTTKLKDQEGVLMKRALQSCATVDDFEQLLRTLPKPLGVEANFGVIDAQGGAAYFETGNYGFRKFDATDPAVAPFGYLIRTNYSFTGERKQDYGLIRYTAAEQLFYKAALSNQLTVEFLTKTVSRCLRHGLTGVDLSKDLPETDDQPTFVSFADFIPRFSSSASVVVQGVKPGEPVALTTMWTMLGFPLCAVAVPVWVAAGPDLPKVLVADAKGKAPLSTAALTLKGRCFPFTRDSGRNYLDLAAVMNRRGTGILQRVLPVEESIAERVRRSVQQWEQKGFDAKEAQTLYRWIDATVTAAYRREFGLILQD
ncbi:MAG: hypothetical protein ONB25_10260 [candidate division KSB1 bacterium]|nr:hypothetical protein [candidate division KSB1 bacterium]MDZ7412348.1 hypothetical protein [candidate division KSB1 bacterium]